MQQGKKIAGQAAPAESNQICLVIPPVHWSSRQKQTGRPELPGATRQTETAIVAVYERRRRNANSPPIMPKPASTSVEGSGTTANGVNSIGPVVPL